MKITAINKDVIIGLFILIVQILMIYLNCTSFIIDNTFNNLLFLLSTLICFISSFLFSIKLKTSDKASRIISIISFLASILFSYIIIELLNQNTLFNLDIKRLIFNFILIILLHLFIYALSNKISLSIILSNFLIFILGVVNYALICFRGTPFVPWDILSIKTAASVANNYTFEFTYYFLLAFVLFVFMISIGEKAIYTFKKSKINLLLRFCFLTITICFSIAFYTTNIIDYFELETNLWRPKVEYINNGFLASFAKQSKNLFVEKPKNYSIKNVENIVSKSVPKDVVVKATKDSPNIIVIMNECFSDLKVNGSFSTSEEYMPFIKSLSEDTIKGNAYVSVFGGTTSNSEWEFLTNNSMGLMPHNTVPYQQYIKTSSYSLATTLQAQGYTSHAIHPWYATGYRRNAVYPLLGFDSFESIETLSDLDYIREYPSDLSTYNKIIEQFENKKENEKLFNFTVTMQNHSGYTSEEYESTIFLSDIDNCPQTEQYLSLIKESDSAFEYLINYFKNYNEKTIILFFGDHQPSSLEDKFWNSISTNSNETNKYITPFVLWANYDIEEKYIENISLNYLSILLLDTANLKTTPYMSYLKNLQKKLPVITGNGYMDKDGNFYTFDNNNNKYSEVLNTYRILQYNNVFDFGNTVKSFFEIK